VQTLVLHEIETETAEEKRQREREEKNYPQRYSFFSSLWLMASLKVFSGLVE